MNHSILQCTIDIAKEAVLPKKKDEDLPRNIVSEALVKFFELLSTPTEKTRFIVNKQEEDIPLFRLGKNRIRLLIIPSNCTNRVKDYFKQLALRAYSIDSIKLNRQGFLFVDSDLSNMVWLSDRFFHVMCSIFKHSEIGWKVQADKLLTFFSPGLLKDFLDKGGSGTITNRVLRNSIEETCFASGVEEMREFLLRDPVIFHNIFNKLVTDDKKENKKKEDEALKIKQGVVRLVFGAYLAGDIDREILGKVLDEFSASPDFEISGWIESLNKDVEDLNRQVHSRFRNPLWKYLQNRKILVVEDRLEIEEEGWSAVLPALFLSPKKYRQEIKGANSSGLFSKIIDKRVAVPIEVIHFKDLNKALDSTKTDKNPLDLADFDLILLDLYSSSPGSRHGQSIQITNMKDPLWQLIEKLDDIRKSHIEKSIPQPMPQIIVFSRDDKGLTVRTMFKELNAADYFFKITGAEEHKCGYYSSFRNAVLSALKENIYQVGGMTGIPSRLHFNKWLRQFDPCDRPLILHLMKHFKYFPASSIVHLLDSYLKNNTRWEDGNVSTLNSEFRKPGRFYISYLGHPNKSGPATLPLLSKTEWIKNLREKIEKPSSNKLPGFISYERLQRKIKSSIKRGTLAKNPLCLIFVDDVVASGGQLKNYMEKFIGSLIKNPTQEKLTQLKSLEIIALFALGVQNNKYFENMIQKFERNKDETHSINGSFDVKLEGLSTKVQVHVAHYTKSIQEIFQDDKDNNGFLKNAEETLRKYAVIMELREEDYPCNFIPWGWKENGGLLATYANAQGNTIPVIWLDYKSKNDEDVIPQENGLSISEWEPLFPRYFNPLTPVKKQDNQDLDCKTKGCPVNPSRWSNCFLKEHWEKYEDPPCKIKPGR